MSRKKGDQRDARKETPDAPRLAGDPNRKYCKRLAEEAAKAGKDRNLDRSQGRVSCLLDASSPAKLERDAKLQWDAVIETGYSPSKWLLEQELKARKRWDAGAKQFLDEPCYPHDEGEPLFQPGSPETRDVYEIAAEQELTGLCFSGGGIRSATFNLGVLQGFAELGLLPFMDYLSSVSGGGYIHQFLAAWILRDREGRAGVQGKLIPRPESGCPARPPEPIRWLQRYASYLTPRRGILSTDTWTMVAIWFRNTVLNQIPITVVLAAAFFVLNLLAQEPLNGVVSFSAKLQRAGELATLRSGVVILLAVAWSVWMLGRDLYRQENISHPDGSNVQPPVITPLEDADASSFAGVRKVWAYLNDGLLSNEKVRWFIIMPWLAMAVWATYWPMLKFSDCFWWRRAVPYAGCAVIVMIALVIAFAGGAWRAYKALHQNVGSFRRVIAWAEIALAAVSSGAVACGIGYGFQIASQELSTWICVHDADPASVFSMLKIDPWRVQIVVLPALLLTIPYIAIELTLGLLGRDYADTRREWLARLRAWSLLYGLLWMGLTGIALLAPYLARFVVRKGLRATIPAVAVFVVSHLTTFLAGSSGKSDGKPTSDGFLGYKPMDLVAMAAAPLAIVSFLVVLSSAVERLGYFLVILPQFSQVKCWIDVHSWIKILLSAPPAPNPQFAWKAVLLICAALCGLLAWIFGCRLDINEFSMQSFYRNRLSRCYLGASLWDRSPNPFTGLDMRSRLDAENERAHTSPPLVKDILPDQFNLTQKPEELKGSYDGPFPIFCSTLNLTTGEDLASQERKGASFAFTPLLSGYSVSWTDAGKDEKVSLNGYVPTKDYAYPYGGIHLDTAVAISGAAVNPNQGYNSNPALAFLMTFFNVRLGWWISNPRKIDAWRADENRPTPPFALWYLLRELFGSANDRSKYVNLSDGGHFENMGLYELVRRRCTYIVVCDAEEDPEMKFCGIGNAVNRCRADFGAEIDLDLRPLQKKDDGFSQAHCVVGTIRYPPPTQQPLPDGPARNLCECLGEVDREQYTGTILYIKSSLVGDEPADLLAYKLQHDTFPQDPTANQWFTETQFESYRRLGHHIAMTAIRPALKPDRDQVKERDEIAGLFRNMYSIWYPPTPEMQQYLAQHMQQYREILTELRQRPELAGLAERLNDERSALRSPVLWDPPEPLAQSKDYAWQFANTLLDFMYTVYTDLELAFPDNRTSPHADWWVCLFRRWCRVELVRETWLKLEPIYSGEFQLFARRELMLP